MKPFLFIHKYSIASVTVLVLFLACAFLFTGRSAHESALAAQPEERTIQLVTGEFKSTLPNGKTIEAYRWDPGTVYVNKGDLVHLHIFGVNGSSHPFVIEGMNIKGEVRKGRETTVTFAAERQGIFRLVCQTHADIAHNGPMVGYIVVH
jgi:plastocyanin